jgi:hypothetical protein
MPQYIIPHPTNKPCRVVWIGHFQGTGNLAFRKAMDTLVRDLGECYNNGSPLPPLSWHDMTERDAEGNSTTEPDSIIPDDKLRYLSDYLLCPEP